MVVEKIDRFEGLIKRIIPKKPTNNPKALKKFNSLPLNNRKEISRVKRGIVPMRVDATILSTYISLRLIRLNGKTFPKIAIPINSPVFLENIFLKAFLWQKNIRKNDAIRSL